MNLAICCHSGDPIAELREPPRLAENRHKIGGEVVPRDLGFDAVSALATASFKAFAWGLTSHAAGFLRD